MLAARGKALMKEWLEKLRIALGARRHAYRTTFKGPYADVVLKDIARFCRAHETTLNANEKLQDAFEGRRQVWLRIQEHLQLTPDQLWELYSGRPTKED